MKCRAVGFWILVASFAWIACGETSSSGECVPGQSIECACPGGGSGGQACKDDGSGYEPCDCGTSDIFQPGDVDPGDASEDTPAPSDSRTEDTPPNDTPPPEDTDPGLPTCEKDADCPPELPQCTPQGTCVFCYPGTKMCEGNKLMVCHKFGGSYELLEDCSASQGTCDKDVGVCISPCGGFGKLALTNAGCEFFAVDLRNAKVSTPAKYLNAQDAPFAVIVSNVSQSNPANVTVTAPDGQTWTADVEPMGLSYFLLPTTFGIPGPGRFNSAYRIQSTSSIVAYQFNPLDNVDVFSNDASVLLPVAELGMEYFAMTLEHFSASSQPEHQFPGYITIVGVQPQPTQVTITPTADTEAAGDIPAMTAGMAATVSVGLNEVIQIEEKGGDLTGTRIQSNKPVLVFSGHLAGRPDTECCSDHLEQQLPPVSRWGKEFVLGRSMERGKEKDYVRVLAALDGTQVQISGSATPGGFSLNRGGFQEVMVDGHIKITADKPVLVAQFLAPSGDVTIQGPCNSAADCGEAYVCEPFSSSSSVDVCLLKACTSDAECGFGYACNEDLYGGVGKECKPIGDPAMILAVPEEQWQQTFVFLTPNSYLHDYINLVIPEGSAVTLDGTTIPQSELVAVPGTTHRLYRAEVTDGVHIIESEEPASLTVYGYDAAVSYGYPGAMGLKNLLSP